VVIQSEVPGLPGQYRPEMQLWPAPRSRSVLDLPGARDSRWVLGRAWGPGRNPM